MHKINGHRPVDILYQNGQVNDRLFNHCVHLSRPSPQRLPIHCRPPYPTSSEPRISHSRMRFAMEVVTRNSQRTDPNLTLTYAQHPAIVGNAGHTNPFAYATFANL